jgi:hypothetical protein
MRGHRPLTYAILATNALFVICLIAGIWATPCDVPNDCYMAEWRSIGVTAELALGSGSLHSSSSAGIGLRHPQRRVACDEPPIQGRKAAEATRLVASER